MSNKELTKHARPSTARTSGKHLQYQQQIDLESTSKKDPLLRGGSDAPIVIAWIPSPPQMVLLDLQMLVDRTAAQPSTEEKLDMIEEPVHRKRLESRTQSSRAGIRIRKAKVETKTKPKTATTEGSSRHRGSSQSKADQNYNDRSRLASTSRPGSSLNTRKLEPPATRSPIDFRKLSSYKEKTRPTPQLPSEAYRPSVLRSLNSSKTTRSDTPAPKQHRPSSTSKTRGSSRTRLKRTSKAIEKGVRALSKKRTKSPEPKGNKLRKTPMGYPERSMGNIQ
ncbi:hypothetical protein BZA77DRAFT_356844 [Pyronema omphalodes]|nr:hypothetical protein BZA77DRAFT_356844 [Pyronema omphalodes]